MEIVLFDSNCLLESILIGKTKVLFGGITNLFCSQGVYKEVEDKLKKPMFRHAKLKSYISLHRISVDIDEIYEQIKYFRSVITPISDSGVMEGFKEVEKTAALCKAKLGPGDRSIFAHCKSNHCDKVITHDSTLHALIAESVTVTFLIELIIEHETNFEDLDLSIFNYLCDHCLVKYNKDIITLRSEIGDFAYTVYPRIVRIKEFIKRRDKFSGLTIGV